MNGEIRLSKMSVFWASAEMTGNTIFAIAAMLLMARLLGPSQFGIGAIAIGTVSCLNVFVEGLFHDGLIQNPDTDDERFETYNFA